MGEPGILLIDKPSGITSHGVVARVRKSLNTRKVGHAGTLDPAATGLLVLGVNRGTKLLHFLTGLDKTYLATVRLGASTVTDDFEGEVITDGGAEPVSLDEVESAMSRFRGDIMQAPSSVSAIKVDGERAHRLVRAGVDVQIPKRPVAVRRFEIIGVPRTSGKYLDLDVVVDCSSGTYVRSLARDLGNALGVGGHLLALRRTVVGPWAVEDARSLDAENLAEGLLSLGGVCSLLYPSFFVTTPDCKGVPYGKQPNANSLATPEGTTYTMVCPNGEVLGLGSLQAGRLRPVFIINPV